VAVVGADEETEAEAGEVDGVLVAVSQRSAGEVSDRGVETFCESGPGFKEIAVLVVVAG
jgi:hypothetical protein